MSLKEISEKISMDFEKKVQELLEERSNLNVARDEAAEEYRKANTGDRSENAPLEQAIANMQKVNSKTIKNEAQIKLVEQVDDLSRYNSVGIVVIYSTVRIDYGGKERIYKIYPASISYVDIGIMAANSRLAIALMGKTVGDTVFIKHDGTGEDMKCTILEIY